MAKMMGKMHDRQCDCGSPYVSGAGEKCNRRYGNSRQRSREAENWARDESDTCWCDDKEVYAVTHPEESKYSAPRDMLCKDCCTVRCDAYPGACRGVNYYD